MPSEGKRYRRLIEAALGILATIALLVAMSGGIFLLIWITTLIT